MTARVKAWQCIGCGRLDAPQSCIGVCEDRKVELVGANEYDRAVARIEELEAALRLVACATPRAGAWERSYRWLQETAQELLARKLRP